MFKIFIDCATKRRHVMTNPKRSVAYNKKKLPHHRFFNFEAYKTILMHDLGLEQQVAGKILAQQQFILDIPKEHIIEQCHICKTLDVDPTSLIVNARLLGLRSRTLRHRVMLLKDMGVPRVHAAWISNYLITTSMRMELFKAQTGIPKDVNVADNLLKCLHEPPSSVPPLEELSEELSVSEYHKRCLHWYMQWRFNLPKEDVEATNAIVTDTLHKSFSLLRDLFDILHEDFGFTTEKIRKWKFLRNGSARDLRKIIAEIKTFAGVNFEEVFRRHPMVVGVEYENVVRVMKLLAEYGYTNSAMIHRPEILLLKSSLVAMRLESLETKPELRVLKNNNKVLDMVYHFNMVEARLNYLRYLNMKGATIRLLDGFYEDFDNQIRAGVDRTFGSEIAFSIEKLVRLDKREIKREIKKHPFWRHVDLVSIRDTLDFLLERFAPEDLHGNLQILLYPREKIAEVLESISEQHQTPDKPNRFTAKQIVAICLYEIEREHHFSGDGLWKYDATPPTPRESKKKQTESSDSNFSDSEIAESDEKEESTTTSE